MKPKQFKFFVIFAALFGGLFLCIALISSYNSGNKVSVSDDGQIEIKNDEVSIAVRDSGADVRISTVSDQTEEGSIAQGSEEINVETDVLINAAEIIARKDGAILLPTQIDDALQTLAKAGDPGLKSLAQSLYLTRISGSKESSTQRMAVIDLLGYAARSYPVAREELFKFSTSALDFENSDRAVHMDLADRLEAFSLSAPLAKPQAEIFINGILNEQLHKEYVYAFYIGLRMKGESEDEALDYLYKKFGSHGG